METYVLLFNLTGQGVKDIKDAPDRIRQGTAALEGFGGKLVSFHAVMGPYDYVGIGEMPNAEAAAAYSLTLSALGDVKVQTLRAFSVEEFAEIVGRLP